MIFRSQDTTKVPSYTNQYLLILHSSSKRSTSFALFLLSYVLFNLQLIVVTAFPLATVVYKPRSLFRSSGCTFQFHNNDVFFLKQTVVKFSNDPKAARLQPAHPLLDNYNNNNNNNGGGKGGAGGGGYGGPPQNNNNNNNDDEDAESNFWVTLSSAGISAATTTIEGIDLGNPQGKNGNQTFPLRVILHKVTCALTDLEYFIRHTILRQPTEEEKAYQRLRATVVQSVTCNSTLLPDSVVQLSAKRGRMIGSPLLAETVQETARLINQWYQREGYTLSSMTGATLVEEESGAVELVVEEPKFSNPCVAIAYAKPILQSNNISSSSMKSSSSSSSTTPLKDENRTITYRVSTTEGRTNPMVIQRALGFIPGAPFQWREREWREMSSSIRAVFSSILHAEPHRLEDGTVQFRIIAQERNAGNFAYGVTKSLMKVSTEQSNNPASNLEGELSFDYGNVFGGGETVSFSVRRAAKDPEASYRFSYCDEEFCTSANNKHGWRVEGFNQYVGKGDDLVLREQSAQTNSRKTSTKGSTIDGVRSPEGGIDSTVVPPASSSTVIPPGETLNLDSEVIRKGASFMVQNPLSSCGVQRSATELSAERLVSTSGKSENIISATIGIGPFIQSLPRDGRHSIQFAVGAGSRLGGILWGEPLTLSNNDNNGDVADSNNASSRITLPFRVPGSIPFTHASVTVREVFPFSTSSTLLSTKDRPITLALKHTVSACTDTIPTTKAIAHAAAHKVRGYGSDRRSHSATEDEDDPEPIFHGYQGMVMGTTEVRIPVTLPTNRFTQDASIVVFGDWLFAKLLDGGIHSTNIRLFPKVTRKSSVGVGLRKTIQGFPLQYDISLTEHGKIGAFLNFGRDFDVY